MASTGSRSAGRRPTISRPTYDVFGEALAHLARDPRLGAHAATGDAAASGSSRSGASALRHDPDGFWVAEADGGLVGFGIAVQREHVWYLAALHVRPAYQSRGRRRRDHPAGAGGGPTRAAC